MIHEQKLQQFQINSKIFNGLKSNIQNSSLLFDFRNLENEDKNIYRELIKIIKFSAHLDGIEIIAGRAISIIKKICQIIRWENFSNIHLKDCSMRGINFVECNFSESILENVIIDSCWFLSCCLDKVRWTNIICCEQKIIKVDDLSKLLDICISPDGTQLISLTQKGNLQNINIKEFRSGNNYQNLPTKMSEKKIIYVRRQIIAFINDEEILQFQNISNGKIRYKKFIKPLDRLYSYNNGMMILKCYNRKIFLYQDFKQKTIRKISFKDIEFLTASRNQQYIANCQLGSIEIWDLMIGKIFILNESSDSVRSLSFSPNNFEFVAVKDNAYIWNIKQERIQKIIMLNNHFNLDNQSLVFSNFSNDGSIVFIQQYYCVNFYDTQTGQHKRCLYLNMLIQSVCFHPAQKILLLSCDQTYIYYLDYMTKQQSKMKYSKLIDMYRFTLSKDAEFIGVVNAKRQIQIINTNNGSEIMCRNLENITSIAFSPINNTLALGKLNSQVSLYNIEKQDEFQKFQGGQDYGKIKYVIFSPNGKLLAFEGSNINQVVLWDIGSGKQEFLFVGLHIDKIQFSSDGSILASASDETIRLWDIQKRKEKYRKQVCNHMYNYPSAFSPDVRYFVSVYHDTKITFFEIQLNNSTKIIQLNGRYLQNLKFSPDGQLLVCLDQKCFVVFEVETGQILQSFKNYLSIPTTIDFSSNGKMLIIGQKEFIKLWEIYQEKFFQTLEKTHQVSVTFLAYSQVNQVLISGDQDGNVCILDHMKQKLIKKIQIFPNETKNNIISLSKTGNFLAFVEQDQIINVLNLKTFAQFADHEQQIQAMDFSISEKQLISSEQNSIYIWDVYTKKLLKILSNNLFKINQLFFAQDDQEIYFCSSGHNIQQISIRKETSLQTLHQHSVQITSLIMFPGKKMLALGSLDGKISILDLSIKKITQELQEHEDQIIAFSISLDGNILASLSKDNTVCYWKTDLGIIYEKILLSETVYSLSFLNDGFLAYGCNDGKIKIIQMLRKKIRPLNFYSTLPKGLQAQNSSFNGSYIISTNGFDLLKVLKNEL